ncbi:hypothetical protein EVAR_93797_1 [Eumeta japonica]|uniref:Uncharacterized protein n=1 Tax=Eumeta variegata TaxID=151549 RepID=A0A4C1VDS8_EUMVA|nr:hypothetical protein EVAR_93797_1 [Eumeta japonica]
MGDVYATSAFIRMHAALHENLSWHFRASRHVPHEKRHRHIRSAVSPATFRTANGASQNSGKKRNMHCARTTEADKLLPVV